MSRKRPIALALFAPLMTGLLCSCTESVPVTPHATDEDLVAPALGVLHQNFKMKDLVGDQLGADGRGARG